MPLPKRPIRKVLARSRGDEFCLRDVSGSIYGNLDAYFHVAFDRVLRASRDIGQNLLEHAASRDSLLRRFFFR